MTLEHQFLIAMPTIQDDIFKKSVVYLCEHNSEGAIGLMINHEIQCPLEVVFKQMHIEVSAPGINETPIMMGGPMHQEHGFVIHRNTEEKWRSSLNMVNGISITTSHDVLEAIAVGKGPQDMMLVLGYAGWDKGQLEEEIASNAWLTCPADMSLFFDVPCHKRWEAAGALLGINMNYLSMDLGHA